MAKLFRHPQIWKSVSERVSVVLDAIGIFTVSEWGYCGIFSIIFVYLFVQEWMLLLQSLYYRFSDKDFWTKNLGGLQNLGGFKKFMNTYKEMI